MKKSKKKTTQTKPNFDFTVGDTIEDNRGNQNPTSKPKTGLFPELQTSGGAQKAARLLLALGADDASRILQQLRENEVRVLIEEMTRIRFITIDEKRKILDEFQSSIPSDLPIEGGSDVARDILVRSFGETKAEEIFHRLESQDARRHFDFLALYEPQIVASVLSNEHPQIAAVTLSYMKPSLAAQAFKHFPVDTRMDLCTRIGRSARISPDAITKAAKSLQEKFEKRLNETFRDAGGADTLAGILNHLDRGLEEEILVSLQKKEPELFELVRERLYTFEELIHLDTKELRLLLSPIDIETLATALRGAAEDLRRSFFNALSQNRAADVLDEMDRRGPISIREINEARSYILHTARTLDQDGVILIKKGRDEYI